MKFDCGWEIALLNEICSGTLILYKSNFYIVTNTHPANKLAYIYCTNIDTGELEAIPTSMLVRRVDEATLKIGGYYK